MPDPRPRRQLHPLVGWHLPQALRNGPVSQPISTMATPRSRITTSSTPSRCYCPLLNTRSFRGKRFGLRVGARVQSTSSACLRVFPANAGTIPNVAFASMRKRREPSAAKPSNTLDTPPRTLGESGLSPLMIVDTSTAILRAGLSGKIRLPPKYINDRCGIPLHQMPPGAELAAPGEGLASEMARCPCAPLGFFVPNKPEGFQDSYRCVGWTMRAQPSPGRRSPSHLRSSSAPRNRLTLGQQGCRD